MTEDAFLSKNYCLKEFPENKTLCFKIRSFLFKKFGVWNVWDLLPYRWSIIYYDKIKPIIKPKHCRIRKSIPRQWCDITSLIVNVNFEFIKAFYEDEYVDGVVDWTATEQHKEFAEWLEGAYKYIDKERPLLEQQKENSYPKSPSIDDMFEPFVDDNGRKMFKMKDDGIPYDVKYGEVNRLEKLIDEKDTEILTQLIKRRDYFWT